MPQAKNKSGRTGKSVTDAAQQWVGVVNDRTGELVSIGTADALAPDDVLTQREYSVVNFAGRPDLENNLWDSSKRVFVAVQRIDRVDDFVSGAGQQFSNLPQQAQTALKSALANLLGARRYRNQQEPPSL